MADRPFQLFCLREPHVADAFHALAAHGSLLLFGSIKIDLNILLNLGSGVRLKSLQQVLLKVIHNHIPPYR